MAKIISTSNIKKGFDNPFVNLSQHKSFFSIVLASLAVIMILITYSAVQQQRVYKSSAACTNPTRCNTPGEQSNCCSGYNCNPLYICASCGTQGATCALPGFISNCCSGYT